MQTVNPAIPAVTAVTAITATPAIPAIPAITAMTAITAITAITANPAITAMTAITAITKSNPERIVSQKIGSRNSQTTVYYLDNNIQIVCGCFKGNIEQFEEKVKLTHANNPKYLEQYTRFIELVKYVINYKY